MYSIYVGSLDFSGFQYQFYTTVITEAFRMLTFFIYTEEKFYEIPVPRYM